nr:hypothetical protein [Tanacetum cinerariifolium]
MREMAKNSTNTNLFSRVLLTNNEFGYESLDENEEADIESMTIADYNLYIGRPNLKKNPLTGHSCGFTPQFFAQTPHTLNTSVDKKDSGLDEILDDLDMNHESGNLLNFLIFLATNEFLVFVNMTLTWRKKRLRWKMMMGDAIDIWDITVKDVERIRQFLMPNFPDEMDKVIQPLIPQPIYTTPPNDDYVAPATKLILDKLLEEFRDIILNVTMVNEEADLNPTKDIEDVEILLAKHP